uniref:Uncharacterized protein n=1 Tax=Spongospora subterranea TaxID=70186 RepID=A0A0H5R2I2_9EUKA|eukprot:CRZ02089.1 hypothetical protein [Spongospora subterranea]
MKMKGDRHPRILAGPFHLPIVEVLVIVAFVTLKNRLVRDFFGKGMAQDIAQFGKQWLHCTCARFGQSVPRPFGASAFPDKLKIIVQLRPCLHKMQLRPTKMTG